MPRGKKTKINSYVIHDTTGEMETAFFNDTDYTLEEFLLDYIEEVEQRHGCFSYAEACDLLSSEFLIYKLGDKLDFNIKIEPTIIIKE